MASGEHSPIDTRDQLGTSSDPAPNLLGLLSNTLVLYQTVPYLPITAVLNLAAASQSFRQLLHTTPGALRHLDLTQVKSLQSPVSPDRRNDGPLRGALGQLAKDNILQDVNTLVLDGLSVTAEFVTQLLATPSLRIRTLSLREVKNLNEGKLMQALRSACRSSQPEGIPRVKALYYFGSKDDMRRDANAVDDWYCGKNRTRVVKKEITEGWAETIWDCRGIIRFDAALCTGPRHPNSAAHGKDTVPIGMKGKSRWKAASFAMNGCASCGTAPEGFTVYGNDACAEDVPLLSPIPLHSSTLKAATCPKDGSRTGTTRPQFIPRCLECIEKRYCFSCDKWWCEDCYQVPGHEELYGNPSAVQIVDESTDLTDHEIAALEQPKVKRLPKVASTCFDCKYNCVDCRVGKENRCQSCSNMYCTMHAEGSTTKLCDWCAVSRRGVRCRDMY